MTTMTESFRTGTVCAPIEVFIPDGSADTTVYRRESEVLVAQ
jgi:hypothetical protein